jgi:thiosulfate/3-mercaptopyruvate sulfurtransferase
MGRQISADAQQEGSGVSTTTGDFRWMVDANWLEANLRAPGLVVLDCSWLFAESGRNAHEEYLEERIPGALFFDIDKIANTDTSLPHMLPSPEKFAQLVGDMGIGNDDIIIVYDSNGFYSAAARVWWMFRVMGHHRIKVLDGGFPKWFDENRPIDEDFPLPTPEPKTFIARFDSSLVQYLDDIKKLTETDSTCSQLVDARSPERFYGQQSEPRAGVKMGHIPGSSNLFITELINVHDGSFKPLWKIREVLEANLKLDCPVVTTCGSGVTAAVINLALAEIGIEQTSMYDGSWAEWGATDSKLPIATS